MEHKQPEYDLLNKFVGHWMTSGKIPATSTSPEIILSGSDIYTWLPGGFFLMHQVDVLVGDDKNETLEIIGFDPQKSHFTLQHYDNKGNSGLMTGKCQDDVWTFLGENLRFTGGFKNQGTAFSGIWEQSADGETWTHLMEIKLTKSK
jgi:hypothetical protein